MELIKIYNNSLSHLLCDNIINIFESSDNKSEGETNGGIQKEIKNTMDLLSFNIENEEWKIIDNFIRKELNNKLDIYYYEINNGNLKNCLFSPYRVMEDSGFQIQKYNVEEGFYIFHNDFNIIEPNKFRVLTYLWYLNDVEEGGETEFYNGMKIKPEKGKLLIFPACWTYAHKGNIPISNDKYIMTGWIYCNF